MNLKKNISSLKLPHYKATAGMESVRVAPPKEVLLPMNMHSGQAAEPVVAAGEHVYLGQLIAREEGRNSVPVHATVSGTVKAIEQYESEPGRSVAAIRIESDGKMEKDPAMAPPKAENLDEFLTALRGSGIVGLGGAAFPLWAKLDAARRGHIKTVLVNGAECEPFITSDHRTMLEHTDLIVKGVALLKRYLESEEFIIGIEKNKPDAIEKLTKAFADDPAVTVKPLKSVYPQGAKQVLLYNAAGLVVGEGQRLASLGYIIINVTTLAKMAYYMETGMPLVDRCVTVDGSAVKEPKNLVVPVGTPISYLIENCGGLKEEPGKVLYCGAMMGMAVPDLDLPVQKTTNATLAFNKADAHIPDPTACIRCGNCINHCPLKLAPKEIETAYRLKDPEKLSKLKVNLCMECGCCSYICPAKRPLVQTNKLAKVMLRDWQKLQEQKAKEETELKEAEERKEAATNE